MLYGQLGYFIPIEPLRAGAMDAPGLFLRAATGAAWDSGESADFKVNLMGGLRFWVVEGGLAVDPDGGDTVGYGIVRFPGDL